MRRRETGCRRAAGPDGRMTTLGADGAESLHQAVPDDRGTDAAAALREPGDGRADHLPPRARLRRDLRGCIGPPAGGLPDPQPGSLLRLVGHRGDGVGGGQPRRARRPGRRRLCRQVRRALAGAVRGLRRRERAPGRRVGRGDRPGPARGDDRGHARASQGGVRDPVRDLDRGRPRRPGADRGRSRPRRGDRRRRRFGPGRRRSAPGRVGGGRGRLRLPEVADVPARPWLRLGERACP